jgi:TonB family protein
MRTIFTFLIISLFANVNAQKTYIQVVAEPGVSVFLDGTFKGKTSADFNGLILEDITPGEHLIKVVKEGFVSQEDLIRIKVGEVYTHRVKQFLPAIHIEQKGNTGEQMIGLPVGQVKIQSLPVDINISIQKLGINSAKQQDEWIATQVPIGSYDAVFKGLNNSIIYTIEVTHNQITHLFVNLLSSEIEDRSQLSGNINGIAYEETQGISFSLSGRTPVALPKPEYNIQREGIVVVEVTLDNNGNITNAVPGVRGSTTINDYLLNSAKNAALKAKFNAKHDGPRFQKGTITYHFKLL